MHDYLEVLRKPIPLDFVAMPWPHVTRAVALKLSASESWVRRIKQERCESGKIAPSRARRRTPRWAPQPDRIREVMAEKPD